MALLYPDILEHNNPANPLMDENQLWGSLQIVDDIAARDLLPIAKRKVGMVVVYYSSSLPILKKYIGPDVTDPEWTDNTNWVDLSYPYFNYDITQTLSANTTTAFLVGDKNIYASFILYYQMVRDSVIAIGTIEIMQNISSIESPTFFTFREFGGTLGLVTITTALNGNNVEVSVQIDGSSASDVTMVYNLIRKPFVQFIQRWSLVDSSSFSNFNNIVFPGATTVVIGASGSVEYSLDNGDSYSNAVLPSAAGYTIFQLNFIDANNGFICGQDIGANSSRIWGTVDGGQNWTLITTLAAQRLWGLWMFDALNGLCYRRFGGQSVISQTTDGGLSFSDVYVADSSVSVGNFQFVDALNGFLNQFLTNHLYVTTDGGANWTDKITPISYNGYFALDANNIWIVGASSAVRYSNDGGDTWFTWDIAPSVGLINSVFAFSVTHVIVGYNADSVSETTDGGTTWVNTHIGIGASGTIVSFRNQFMGVAHGSSNIYKYS
ncbi:MAG: hypothetical protein PHT07_15095 [Paludibacter sp.]|nr:hypothetical protein [Paludibacter sp.]